MDSSFLDSVFQFSYSTFPIPVFRIRFSDSMQLDIIRQNPLFFKAFWQILLLSWRKIWNFVTALFFCSRLEGTLNNHLGAGCTRITRGGATYTGLRVISGEMESNPYVYILNSKGFHTLGGTHLKNWIVLFLAHLDSDHHSKIHHSHSATTTTSNAAQCLVVIAPTLTPPRTDITLLTERLGGKGENLHMKAAGMLVDSLRGENFGFWSHLGCSGQNRSRNIKICIEYILFYFVLFTWFM